MPVLALSDLLPDFGSRAHRGALQAAEPQTAKPEPVAQQTPIVDTAAMIAEAVANAEAAVTERLAAIYEATLEAERDSHAAQRDELSRGLGTEAGRLIEVRFVAMEEELLTLTAAAAARILGGLLTDEMRKRAIATLSARIREAVRESEAVRIHVVGPQSLCEALAASLGEHAGSIEYTERASFDLSVNIDSSIYETRLAEWSAELAEVLG